MSAPTCKKFLMAICCLGFLLAVCPPGSLHAKSALVTAEELLNQAREKARSIDPDAYLVYVSYDDGTKDLMFEGGDFIFFSPKRKAEGKRRYCLELIFVRGKCRGPRTTGYSRTALEGMHLTPEKAVEAAWDKTLGSWWKRHPKAKLYATLEPAEFVHRAPGFGDRSRKGVFLWELYLAGPGLPEQLRCYVDAKTLEHIGCKVKEVPKEFQSITEEEALKQAEELLKKFKKK